jgi:putative transcriptional regulator
MELAQQVGLRIKELRELRGLTQNRLGVLAAKTSDEISRIERGVREPKFDTLELVAAALQVPVRELFSVSGGLIAKEARPSYGLSNSSGELSPDAALVIRQCADAVQRILTGYLRPHGRAKKR